MSEVENLKERLRLLDAVAAEQISRVLAEKDERIAELEKLAYIGEHHFPDLTYKVCLEEAVADLWEHARRAERRRNLLIRCLLSADPGWEEQNLGHDWADWCEEARSEVLDDADGRALGREKGEGAARAKRDQENSRCWACGTRLVDKASLHRVRIGHAGAIIPRPTGVWVCPYGCPETVEEYKRPEGRVRPRGGRGDRGSRSPRFPADPGTVRKLKHPFLSMVSNECRAEFKKRSERS